MDKEKEEGVLDAIAQAAKMSMEATVEGVTSAATNIVNAVTENKAAAKAEKAFNH
jgi:hypothetical protein